MSQVEDNWPNFCGKRYPDRDVLCCDKPEHQGSHQWYDMFEIESRGCGGWENFQESPFERKKDV